MHPSFDRAESHKVSSGIIIDGLLFIELLTSYISNSDSFRLLSGALSSNIRTTDMAVLSVVTFQLHELQPVVCEYCSFILVHVNSNVVDTKSRFAFVEYESRRDADDAYHEMHNKRIGRDDLLKIEVRKFLILIIFAANSNSSGHVLLLVLHGDLILAVNLVVEIVSLVVEVVALDPLDVVVEPHPPVVAVVVNTPLARMIAVIATMTVVTVVEIVLAALKIGKLRNINLVLLCIWLTSLIVIVR